MRKPTLAYVKAGLSRITTDYSVTYSGTGVGACGPCGQICTAVGTATTSRDSTDIGFAYGAGCSGSSVSEPCAVSTSASMPQAQIRACSRSE